MTDLALSRTEAAHGLRAYAASDSRFLVALSVGLVFLNAFTVAYHLSGFTLFAVISNAVSVVLIAYSIYTIVATHEKSGLHKVLLALACVTTVASFLINWATESTAETLKYLSIYTFYMAGRTAPGQLRPTELHCIYALAALPLIFLAVGETKIYVGNDYPDAFAYFPNKNTAALYFAALFFVLSQRFGNKVLLLQFISAALMNKVGPALATILAICIWASFPLRRRSLIGLLVLGIGSCIAYALGASDRMLTGLDSIALIFNLNPSTVSRLTYKQLAEMTGTTDLSTFFRIMHWSNIWELYSTQGLGTMLFGYGAGQTPYLTYIPLAPHNDYLRILAEYGAFSLLVFISFVIHVAFSIKLDAAKVLFIMLLIYFFSENLIDNFTSMALFFAYAGRFTSQPSRGRVSLSPAEKRLVGRA